MQKIPRLNVSEAAYSAVKQILLSSRYSPGQRIDIEDLCRSLEVSRTPVVEALNRLKAEGMVEIIPRKGAYLVTLSMEKAQELYTVREALEAMASRLAAKRLTKRRLAMLKSALDKQARSLKDEDVEGYTKATIEFHDTILEAAGNKTLSRMLEAVYAQIEALRLRIFYLPSRLEASYAEHQRIYQALAEGDPAAAEREARQHIETTTSEVLSLLADAAQEQGEGMSLVSG